MVAGMVVLQEANWELDDPIDLNALLPGQLQAIRLVGYDILAVGMC